MTRDGFKVPVGCICAGRHIPEIDRLTARATHNKQLRDFRDAIAATIAKAPEIRRKLQWLWDHPYGGTWLASNQHKLRLLPRKARNVLEQLAKQGPVIYEYEELTQAEKEDLKSMGTGMKSTSGAPTARRIERGRVEGLEVVRRRFKDEVGEIEKRLTQMEQGFDAKRGHLEYRRWAKWCGEFDGRFDALDGLLREGMRFFTKQNMALISTHSTMTSECRIALARLNFELYLRPEGDDGLQASMVA